MATLLRKTRTSKLSGYLQLSQFTHNIYSDVTTVYVIYLELITITQLFLPFDWKIPGYIERAVLLSTA